MLCDQTLFVQVCEQVQQLSVKNKMVPKVLSCRRAQENMYVERSQPIVCSCRALKGGCLVKKGHLKRLRPPATPSSPTLQFAFVCTICGHAPN